MRKHIIFFAGVGLTCWVAFVCVSIEIYNVQAGGYLPRRLYDPEYPSKWRIVMPSALSKHMEGRFRFRAEEEGRATDGVYVLTDDERDEIARAIERAEANSDFRAFVGSWGLLQYLAAPGAFLLMVILSSKPLDSQQTQSRRFTNPQRIASICCAVVSGACVVMMLYREYSGSLGW